MIGYTPEEVPDEETWYQKVYPDESYREFVKKEWKEKVLNSHKNSHKSQPIQTKVLCKDGTFKIIESIYQNVENEFITLYKDVTEQYKTEEKLKEINKKIVSHHVYHQGCHRIKIANMLHATAVVRS